MDELKIYVEELFLNKNNTKEIEDLKAEIYSNMSAKKQDLMNQGIPEADAVNQAKSTVLSIDGLLPNNQLTYINRFFTECRQTLFLYSIVLWILTIPTMIIDRGLFSIMTFIIMVVFGIIYLISRGSNKDEIEYCDIYHYKKVKNLVWIIWTVFFFVMVATVSALLFGSNIWFSRPIQITGPYDFAEKAVYYYFSIITVLIPVAVNTFPKILKKYEKGADNEKEE